MRANPVADQLAANLETQLQMAAMLWQIRDPVCGAALAQSAPAMAEYWAKRAAESPAIARAIENVTGAGGLLAGLAVHAPLIMAIAEHHVRPFIERRTQARAAVVIDDDQGGDVGEPVVFPPTMPFEPGRHVVRDGAAWPEGTMTDDAAEHARASAPPPELIDLLDADANWAVAMGNAASAAVTGEPFGMTTYDGEPTFTPPDGTG